MSKHSSHRPHKISSSQYRPIPRSNQAPISPSSSNVKFRKGPWIIGGLAVYSFTTYGFYLYTSLTREADTFHNEGLPEDISDRYDKNAPMFDDQVGLVEMFMGINWLRRRLARKASGHVLEVSVGTGRNTAYYDLKRCKSLTLLDQSPVMMEIARSKFLDLKSKNTVCKFVVQSAHDYISCPDPRGFDTIVQTMGLCSVPKPSALLAHLGESCEPHHGQILLLEHGRSHYDWLNRILDRFAPAHADKHGCWWNRDIGKIAEESGLELIEIKRYHLGTTWWIELRPKRTINSSQGPTGIKAIE